MQRLAWFSPAAPEPAGIARLGAGLPAALARGRSIDLFAPASAADGLSGAVQVLDAGSFERRQRDAPYDLIVHELGAAPAYDEAWPRLLRHPGLVVLHDENFHAARARMLLAEGRGDAWRAELACNHPGVPAAVGSLGASGLLGGLARLWPMRRIVLDAARAVLAHNAWLAARLREEAPGVPVYAVEPGVPDVAGAAEAGAAVRRRLGVAEDAVVFAAAGALTPERRLSRVLRALAVLPEGAPAWQLLLYGEPADAEPLLAEARALGAGGRVSVTGAIGADELPAHLAAADVGISLSWPPARSADASWLRWLAAGKPTIVTDLMHASDVPVLDPRDWTVAGRPSARDAAGRPIDPVAVAVDILDEDHSLGLAAARLATDPALRAELGRAARRLWETRYTLERMAAGYARSIDDACRATYDEARRAHWPPHLRKTDNPR